MPKENLVTDQTKNKRYVFAQKEGDDFSCIKLTEGPFSEIIYTYTNVKFASEENANGQTALMFASLFDRQEIVSSLIEKGANPKHVDKAGNSVADIALSQGNYALAEALNKDNK